MEEFKETNAANLFDAIASFKKRFLGSVLITNWYSRDVPPDARLSIISNESGLCFGLDEANKNIIRLFCICADLESLASLIRKKTFSKDQVIEWVSQEKLDPQIKNTLCKEGFTVLNQLKKMSLLEFNQCKEIHEAISMNKEILEECPLSECEFISNIFKRDFNKFSERPPSTSEVLEGLIHKKIHKTINQTGEFLGFIWIENKKFLSEVKYLYVLPPHRRQGIGAKMMYLYLDKFSLIQKKQLWVLENNSAAIQLYLSLGYKFENTIDTILIRGRLK